MKDKPIMFQGWGVRAILEDRKRMIRRTYGLELINKHPDEWEMLSPEMIIKKGKALFRNKKTNFGILIKCPYQIGQRLWVKETWYNDAITGKPELYYRADGEFQKIIPECEIKSDARWRSAMFMPRWASRINLIMTDIKAERLQEISAKDVIKEGARIIEGDNEWGGADFYYSFDGRSKMYGEHYHQIAFQDLWDSINGKKSPWSKND